MATMKGEQLLSDRTIDSPPQDRGSVDCLAGEVCLRARATWPARAPPAAPRNSSAAKRLALSADKSNILDVSNPERAAQVFSEILKGLRVDASSGQPKLYKPAMVTCVLEGIRNHELTENKFLFDWIAPRFIKQMAALGEKISEREAAMPFFHLTNDLFWMLSYRDRAK